MTFFLILIAAIALSLHDIFTGLVVALFIALLIGWIAHQERHLPPSPKRQRSTDWDFPPRWNRADRYVGPPGRERIEDRRI